MVVGFAKFVEMFIPEKSSTLLCFPRSFSTSLPVMIKQQKYVCNFFTEAFSVFCLLISKTNKPKPLSFHEVPFPKSWSSSPDSPTRFTFSFVLFSTSAICNMRHCKSSFLIYFLSLNEHKQFNYNQQHYMNTIIFTLILHFYISFPSAHLMPTMERVQHCVLPLFLSCGLPISPV